jgi:hypothetical protein
MRKLKLALEALQVESFSVDEPVAHGGTVHGRYLNPEHPDYPPTLDGDACYGGGANTVGTCIGPTYCCGATWKPSCADTCINTQCGNSCYTWWCNTCFSCPGTCVQGQSCTDICHCPP